MFTSHQAITLAARATAGLSGLPNAQAFTDFAVCVSSRNPSLLDRILGHGRSSVHRSYVLRQDPDELWCRHKE